MLEQLKTIAKNLETIGYKSDSLADIIHEIIDNDNVANVPDTFIDTFRSLPDLITHLQSVIDFADNANHFDNS